MEDQNGGSKAFWQIVSKVADLGGAAAVMIPLIVAIVAAAAVGTKTLIHRHALAAALIELLLLPLGILLGVVGVHPILSRAIIRRQTRVETTDYTVSARFEGHSRAPTLWEQRRTIKALSSPLESFVFVYSYGEHSSRVDARCVEGGTISETWSDDGGTHYARVLFPHPVKPKSTHTFCVELRIPDGAESPPFLTVTPSHLMSNVKIRLVFSGDQPRALWSAYWVSESSPVLESDGQSASRECKTGILTLDSSGVVEDFRRRTKPGHRYGVVWSWT